ncbi:MAG: MFS transporter [Ardenticatenia bacterium]|nr:MFS transporter [Ardenticatenia bacterium]
MTASQERVAPVQPPPVSAFVVIFLARTALNTAFRVVYPFLPAMADGLGLSVAQAAQVVNARMVAGLAAPLLGPLSDRYGRRRTLEMALLLMAVAGVILVGWPVLPAAGLAFGLYGLAKGLADPAVHAYIGDTVAFERRGRAVGMVELAWSTSWLVGVPISGVLIERYGWWAPWGALIFIALGCVPLVRRGLPSPERRRVADRKPAWTLVRHVVRCPNARAVLGVTAFFAMSIEVPFIVYGAWLERTFALSLTGLGIVSVALGVAEALAELSTVVITDRVGKRRSVLSGLVGLAISLGVLPVLSSWGLGATLAGLSLMMFSFEFGIVSLIPLISESVPTARATTVALSITVFSAGRLLGGALGGWLWQWEQIAFHSVLGIISVGMAAVLLVGCDERRPQPTA